MYLQRELFAQQGFWLSEQKRPLRKLSIASDSLGNLLISMHSQKEMNLEQNHKGAEQQSIQAK